MPENGHARSEAAKWYYLDMEINPGSGLKSPLGGGKTKTNLGFFDAEEGSSRFEGAVKYVTDFYQSAFVIRKVVPERNDVTAEVVVRDASDWLCMIKLVCVDREASASIH